MKPVDKSSLSSFPSFSLLSKPSLSVVLLLIIMIMFMTITMMVMMTKIFMWGKCIILLDKGPSGLASNKLKSKKRRREFWDDNLGDSDCGDEDSLNRGEDVFKLTPTQL